MKQKILILLLTTILGYLSHTNQALAQARYKVVEIENKTAKEKREDNSNVSIDIEHNITFSISKTPSISKQQPSLINNNISLKLGAFGLRVNDTTESMLQKLGIPTSKYKISDSELLYSYGRNLWVYTHQNLVKQITTENSSVSVMLTNSIAFDNRFDSDWIIENTIGYELTKPVLEETRKGTFLTDSTYRIKDTGDTYIDVLLALKIVDGEKKWMVSGFTYGDSNFTIAEKARRKDDIGYNNILSYIDQFRRGKKPILLEEMPFTPTFEAFSDEGHIIQVYDNHLVLRFSYGELKKLSIYEAIFNQQELIEKWEFGPHYAGQLGKEVVELYGENILALDDYWQVF